MFSLKIRVILQFFVMQLLLLLTLLEFFFFFFPENDVINLTSITFLPLKISAHVYI